MNNHHVKNPIKIEGEIYTTKMEMISVKRAVLKRAQKHLKSNEIITQHQETENASV